MSQALQHLLFEHREVRALLDAFELHLSEMEGEIQADAREASALLEYLSEIFFVKHEEKEETILLPELYRERILADLDELRRLREQHHRGQQLLDHLWKALRLGEEWGPGERELFISEGAAWLRFIRGHFRLEEEHIFPRLEGLMNAELDARMMIEFQKIDRDFRKVPDAQHLKAAAEGFAARTLQRGGSFQSF